MGVGDFDPWTQPFTYRQYDDTDPRAFSAAHEDTTTAAADPFWTELMQLHSLHRKKADDYGSDDDPFANVAATVSFGLPAWLGVAIRMEDKMFRLKTYAKRGSLSNEGVADTFQDLASYALIGKILWSREQ